MERSAASTLSARTRLIRAAPILLLVLSAIAVFPFLPRTQDHVYHQFVDQRAWGSIPNWENVLSNAPFLVIGILGLVRLSGSPPRIHFIDPRERRSYWFLFVGVLLTGVGSSYYHWQPNDERLFWDRLPMIIVFMSFFAATISERLSVGLGAALLWPLLMVGVGSSLWWRYGDDLRPYILVQFFPLLCIPLLLALYPARYTRTADVFVVLGWYVAAKLCEHWDAAIYDMLGTTVSGHTLKHLLSAGAVAWLLRMLQIRRPTTTP